MSRPVTLTISRLATGPTPPAPASVGSTPTWPNTLHTRIADVVATMGPAPWGKRLIADERQLVTLIAAPPGGGNRPHWHADFDEWWVIFAGRLEWELTGGVVVRARQGRHRVGAARDGPPHPERRGRRGAPHGGRDATRDALLQPVCRVRLRGGRAKRVERVTGGNDASLRGLDALTPGPHWRLIPLPPMLPSEGVRTSRPTR